MTDEQQDEKTLREYAIDQWCSEQTSKSVSSERERCAMERRCLSALIAMNTFSKPVEPLPAEIETETKIEPVMMAVKGTSVHGHVSNSVCDYLKTRNGDNVNMNEIHSHLLGVIPGLTRIELRGALNGLVKANKIKRVTYGVFRQLKFEAN